MDYEQIKQTAKELNTSIKDLIALAPGNDPFYVGSPGQMVKAKWFDMVYKKMGSPQQCHIRRVHYWAMSSNIIKPDGKKYENTNKDWGFITLASKYARYAGFVPTENIIDKRNPAPIVNAHNWDHEQPSEIKDETDPEAIIKSIVDKFYCYNPSKTQGYLIEIWCEKSTMNDILKPIASNYGLNLVTGLGEISITAVHQLVERVYEANKPTRIFYISDFDPAGECMPVSISRKIEYFMCDQGIDTDVKLIPIVLTAEQCKKYTLPRTPIKETEKRKDDFEARHGTGATELDALEALYPGELKKIIEEKVMEYFDVDAWNEAINLNREIKNKVNKHLQNKISDVLKTLDLTEFDNANTSQVNIVDDSDIDWLYDSELCYFDQIQLYKKHKN